MSDKGASDLMELLSRYLDACFAVEVEAHRAEQPGANAWSSVPVMRLLRLRDSLCRALGREPLSVQTLRLSDRDRSGAADETLKAAQPEARARAEGIAHPEVAALKGLGRMG